MEYAKGYITPYFYKPLQRWFCHLLMYITKKFNAQQYNIEIGNLWFIYSGVFKFQLVPKRLWSTRS